jgi:hypothetical protein
MHRPGNLYILDMGNKANNNDDYDVIDSERTSLGSWMGVRVIAYPAGPSHALPARPLCFVSPPVT